MNTSSRKQTIRIGGASGFWGDSAIATPQLLAPGTKLDYLVFDYLAETTLAIMSRMRAKDPAAGYATDFISMMNDHSSTLKTQGVKVIANSGGINPLACKAALEHVLRKNGVDLKVGVVMGDELLDRSAALRERGVREMFSDKLMPAGQHPTWLMGGWGQCVNLSIRVPVYKNLSHHMNISMCAHRTGEHARKQLCARGCSP